MITKGKPVKNPGHTHFKQQRRM